MVQKKKTGRVVQMPQTEENQIRARARSLPLGRCYITRGWEESREGNVIVTRMHKQGGVTVGAFLVDLALLGIKDSTYRFNLSQEEYADFLNKMHAKDAMEETDYVLAHNLIYGALEYAESFRIKPHKDFSVSRYILEEDTEEIPLMDIEFGVEGVPTIFTSNQDPHPGLKST